MQWMYVWKRREVDQQRGWKEENDPLLVAVPWSYPHSDGTLRSPQGPGMRSPTTTRNAYIHTHTYIHIHTGLVWSQHKRLFQAIAVSKELGSWTCILAWRCICRNEPRFGVRSTFQIGLKRDRWWALRRAWLHHWPCWPVASSSGLLLWP